LRYVPMWVLHLGLTAVMLVWVNQVAGIGPLHYLFGIAYPALSLAMVRSYYEHRAAEPCKHRIVINEAGWPMRLLYLNNNYHLVHHDLPGLPWYLLPTVYRAHRSDYLARCNGFLIPGYGSLMRGFGFRPIDAPIHPFARNAP
jgi:fatty acid desaturase